MSDDVDNLDVAQDWIDKGSSGNYSAAAIEVAKALALIDIGRSLRDIREELHYVNLRGIPVRKM